MTTSPTIPAGFPDGVESWDGPEAIYARAHYPSADGAIRERMRESDPLDEEGIPADATARLVWAWRPLGPDGEPADWWWWADRETAIGECPAPGAVVVCWEVAVPC